MTFSSIPIWLDCDPGNDDAFALLLSLFDDAFELLGISTVHGNAPLSSTTHNALAVLDTLGVEEGNISVYSGSDGPLEKPPKFALSVHGATGIGGTKLPENPRLKISHDKSYLEAMRDAILEHENEICLVCTGPLTNVSKLFDAFPDLKTKVRYITMMGGAMNMGNVTPYAEFNFNCDPTAASHVLSDEILQSKSIIAPLNFTHTAIASQEVRNMIYNHHDKASPIRKQFYDILMFYAESYRENHGFLDGPPIHDPLALYCLLPMIHQNDTYGYKYLRSRVKVEINGEKEGEMVLVKSEDFDRSGAFIGVSIDIQKFWYHIIHSLDKADNFLKNK